MRPTRLLRPVSALRANPGKNRPAARRQEYHDPLGIPGLRHVGYDLFANASPQGLDAHAHPGAFELCYITRGSLQWWVGDAHLQIGPGDLFLTWPDERHGGMNGVMDPCELFWVSFAVDARRGSLGLSRSECAGLDRALRSVRRRACPGPPSIAGHFRRMLDALAGSQPTAGIVVRASLALLLTEAQSAFATAAEGPAADHSPRIADAIAWMREHLAQPIALESIALQVGLRPSRFRAVFRDETGFTPQDYLAQLRIARAKELLTGSDQRITDIALATGFASSQYFATAFRRFTGFTPRAYRHRQG